MKNGRYSILLISLLVCTSNYGQESVIEKGLQSINTDAIGSQLGFLASDWMEGRETGEKGAYIASDYLASMLQLYGVKPAGSFVLVPGYGDRESHERSYFQNFMLLKTSPGDNQILKIKTMEGGSVRTADLIFDVDFYMNPPAQPVEIEAPVVFVGYGFKNDKIKYNDFNKADLKGKFVMKITGYPAFAEKLLTNSEINESVIKSENFIKETGAAGIIEFNPAASIPGDLTARDFIDLAPAERNSKNERFIPMYSLPGTITSSNVPRIKISVKAADEILSGTGIIIDAYLKKADNNIPWTMPSLTSKSVSLKTDVSISQVPARNVLGIIEGEDPDNIIIVGAHYDHVGMRDGYIWNGADDNASGVVGALMLAKAVVATGKKPQKSIVFAFWTAEEKGLLGSRYYVKNLSYPIKNIRLNFNFDMISRYISDDNKKGVVMTYTKSYRQFRDMTESNLKKYGIDLLIDYQPSDDPSGGSDHRTFAEAGIPIMRFKPGHREEYHTPLDDIGTVDWEIMEKIIRISFTNLWELANSSW